MPSVIELYNQEVLAGHREALAALRELLAQETEPAERRKLANAILRARPVKRAKTTQTTPPPARESARSVNRDTDLDVDDCLDFDDDRGPDEAIDRRADELSRRVAGGPDRQSALRELHAFMLACGDAAASANGSPESS